MFKEQKYINEYNKENYKNFKFRVRKDDKFLLNALSNVDNVNKYIASLITQDVLKHHKYNFINDNVQIDFQLSDTMQDLVNEIEKADVLNDFGLYMNLADAIDSQGKKETTHHELRENEWKQLTQRYSLW